MGGFSNLLTSRGYDVESLTPNNNQIEFIQKNYQHLVTHHAKYEQFNSAKRFGTVINSESFQYISLNEAFEKTDEIILPEGRWIIIDYFGLEKKGDNQKPHHLDTFYEKVKEFNWSVVHEQDITLNILPTLSYVDMYVDRFLSPVKQFAYEKLRYKSPKLFYLSSRIRSSIDKKIQKETKTVNPAEFLKERKYMLLVLEKTSASKS